MLVADGVVEIMLLGQNVNSYGKNLDTPMTFAELLREVEKIEGLERIRFMTSHPKDLSDELIEVMANSKKICRQLHLPVQSGSSRVLKEMNRVYDKEHYLNLVDKIKKAMPDISLTTDIIVGFPGETEEDFEKTLDVIKRSEYLQIFGFIYSKRKGTPAEKMTDQVEDKVAKNRLNRLLEVKNEIINRKSAEMLGKTYEVLVESFDEEKNVLYGSLDSGKTISFKGNKNAVGEFVDVKVIDVKKSVIFGEIVSDTSNFKEKNISFPIEVSILPKGQKTMKLLRENKQTAKSINDKKSKK